MTTSQTRLKILYGVQATGQGHISRARAMAPALRAIDAKVDFLFSGREAKDLYGMERFGDFETRRGMTFHVEQGRVHKLKTVFNNSASQLIADIHNLDVKSYDLVITDYEPITAYAAKIRGVPSLGIGHQYAFSHDIPTEGFNTLSRQGMKIFAPASQSLGVHWHHFGQPVLPPLFEAPDLNDNTDPRKIVVYLNFEELDKVAAVFEEFKDYQFYIYAGAIKQPFEKGHLKFRPTSEKFKKDIEDCAGIICGAGFELATEALHMGKKLLVKPMGSQPEQLSNALALKKLGLGDVMHKLDKNIIQEWLAKPDGKRIIYPDVASAIAEWIHAGQWDDSKDLVKNLWSNVRGLEHLSHTAG